jgi:hypothetical protein
VADLRRLVDDRGRLAASIRRQRPANRPRGGLTFPRRPQPAQSAHANEPRCAPPK